MTSATDLTPSAPSPANAETVRFEPPTADGVARMVIDRPDDAVNAVNLQVIEDLSRAVRAARQTAGVAGLIVTSAKKDQWVAGADLKLVTEAPSESDIEQASRRFQAVLDELAWLPCTTVAAINGAALGGGLELALACDYRIGADSSSLRLGAAGSQPWSCAGRRRHTALTAIARPRTRARPPADRAPTQRAPRPTRRTARRSRPPDGSGAGRP